MTIVVAGEALIDLIPGEAAGQFLARPGGSPYNVAVGLARLDNHVALLARFGDNAFGRTLRAQAETESLDLTFAVAAREPASLAVVTLDADARASYDFYLEGTADWQWTAAELAALPDDTEVFHFGSLAAWLAPGDAVIRAAAARLGASDRMLVSFDPNVRPALLGDPGRARPLIETGVAAAHLVKASLDDIEWLYPHLEPAAVAHHWHRLGAALVVITAGPDGALVYPAAGAAFDRPGRAIELVDTVGAGDAFMSGLIDGLVRAGHADPAALRTIPTASLVATVDWAIQVAAATCERPGADPPRFDELSAS